MWGNKYQTEPALSEHGIVNTKFVKSKIMGNSQIKMHVSKTRSKN